MYNLPFSYQISEDLKYLKVQFCLWFCMHIELGILFRVNKFDWWYL
jgi:hypothetical protein